MATPQEELSAMQQAVSPQSEFADMQAASAFEVNPAFERRIAGMTPQAMQIQQTKNTPFGEYLRQKAQQPVEGETDEQRFRRLYGGLSERERPGTGMGMLRAGLQGGTFGTGDEIAAGVAAAMGGPGTFSDRYRQFVAREREDLARFREDQPVLAYGTEMAGAIPTAVMTAPASAPGLGARLLTGMGTGLVQGGIYGAATGEGLEDRAKGAAMGAALGGGIGAAAPAVGAGVRNVVNRVQQGRAASQAGMSRAAYDTLMRAAQADDALTGQGAQNIRRGGSGAMLADAGPTTRSVLDTAIQRSGPASQAAARAVDDRSAQAGQRVVQVLDDTLGPPEGATAARAAIREGSAPARSQAYQAAYEQPIDYASDMGRSLEELVLTRVPRGALNEANKLMRLEGAGSRQIKFNVGDDGLVTYQSMPDVRQLDYITRALQNKAMTESGKGALGGQTPVGRAYDSLRAEMRGIMRDLVPEYGTALDTAADAISRVNAVKIGQRALSASVPRDEFAQQVSTMTAPERQAAMQGLRSQIDDAMANVRSTLTNKNMDAREAVKAVQTLTSRANREKVAMLIGDDAAGRMFDQLDEALSAFELQAAVATNSRTFGRAAVDEAIQAQTEEGVINAIRGGRPVLTAQQAAATAMGRSEAAKQRIADQTYSEIVDRLTGPRGPAAISQIQQMQQAAAQSGMPGETARQLTERAIAANTGLLGPARSLF